MNTLICKHFITGYTLRAFLEGSKLHVFTICWRVWLLGNDIPILTLSLIVGRLIFSEQSAGKSRSRDVLPLFRGHLCGETRIGVLLILVEPSAWENALDRREGDPCSDGTTCNKSLYLTVTFSWLLVAYELNQAWPAEVGWARWRPFTCVVQVRLDRLTRVPVMLPRLTAWAEYRWLWSWKSVLVGIITFFKLQLQAKLFRGSFSLQAGSSFIGEDTTHLKTEVYLTGVCLEWVSYLMHLMKKVGRMRRACCGHLGQWETAVLWGCCLTFGCHSWG